MAMLTAAALVVFIIEAQIPLPVPIPGAKLGLANAVTLFALFFGKPRKKREGRPGQKPTAETRGSPPRLAVPLTPFDAFMILLCRIILGAVFTGRVVAFIYSVTGGMLGFAGQLAMKRFATNKQIWVVGAVGAVFHNIGQIAAAMVITGTPSIAAYLPLLIIAGVATGIITGLAAQFTLQRLPMNDER